VEEAHPRDIVCIIARRQSGCLRTAIALKRWCGSLRGRNGGDADKAPTGRRIPQKVSLSKAFVLKRNTSVQMMNWNARTPVSHAHVRKANARVPDRNVQIPLPIVRIRSRSARTPTANPHI